MHLESLSNGLGAQSMLLFLMACRREIPATVSITADTGWEKDRKWSNGRRGPISEYFYEVVYPMGKKFGVQTFFTRAVDKDKKDLPDLVEHTRWCVKNGKLNNLKIPMFGSRGGRNGQSCTGKWKIRAINQQMRRLGAKTATTYQGIHSGESTRRVNGRYIHQHEAKDWISVYQDTVRVSIKQADGTKIKVEKDVRWLTHAYPLVDAGHNRSICQIKIVGEGIPYLLSSECDGCPHKDLTRWERTSPETLTELCELEALFNGEFFFTSKRIPLREAIALMQSERAANPEKYKVEADFGCQNAICGV